MTQIFLRYSVDLGEGFTKHDSDLILVDLRLRTDNKIKEKGFWLKNALFLRNNVSPSGLFILLTHISYWTYLNNT